MTCRVCSAPDMSKLTSTAKACSIHVGVDVLVVAIGALRGRSVNSTTLCRSEGPFYCSFEEQTRRLQMYEQVHRDPVMNRAIPFRLPRTSNPVCSALI